MSDIPPREFAALPLETKVAVLYERVDNMSGEVHGIKRALWGVAGSIIVGVFVFALSVASGVIGGH